MTQKTLVSLVYHEGRLYSKYNLMNLYYSCIFIASHENLCLYMVMYRKWRRSKC
jgi:fructose-1,6-bisphosphatase